MERILSYCLFLFLFPLVIDAQTVISMKIDGSINPASADFIHNGIEKANREKAECLIIHLNTPGGLLKSTRGIVSDILESPVPVIVYVSPGGAQAGSAGVFLHNSPVPQRKKTTPIAAAPSASGTPPLRGGTSLVAGGPSQVPGPGGFIHRN